MLSRLGIAPGVPASFDGARAVAFAGKLAAFRGEVRGTGPEHFALAPPVRPRVTVREDGGVDVLFASDPGGGRAPRAADPKAVLAAWRLGEPLVPLEGGGYAPLPADWLGRFGARMAVELVNDGPVTLLL